METWNIGNLEAKSLELAIEFLTTNYVVCVKETRWSRQKTRGVKGYKLWYVDLDDRRHRVGILVSNVILKQLIKVRRCNNRIILVRIVVEKEVISIVSALGPKLGLISR